MSFGIGLGSVHTIKHKVAGCAVTRSVLWGVEVCTASESFTLPPAKALRAQEFIAATDFDPAMTRIPLRRIQELRGKLGHWPACNRALSTELRHVDRLLVVREGLISPKGSLRELKQAYVDFWDSDETIRAHLLTGDSLSQAYTSAYSNVLSLEELLSFHESHDRLVWLGSDATPTQCSAVDYTHRVFNVFSYSFCLEYISKITGLPPGDFMLIALAEFTTILRLIIARAAPYKGEILPYAGDKQNVVGWTKYRRPKNRVAQYFARILNRIEAENNCIISPCYISTGNNTLCDELSRLTPGLSRVHGCDAGVAYVDVTY